MTNYLKENNTFSPIRVSLIQGGCSGPVLGLSLDEEKPQDESFEIQGLTFIIEKSLLEQCGGISIDFNDAGGLSGFTVTSTNPLPLGNESCHLVPCGSGDFCH